MGIQDFYAKYGKGYSDKIRNYKIKKSKKELDRELDILDLVSKYNDKHKEDRYTVKKNDIRNDWLLYRGNKVYKYFSDYDSLVDYCNDRKIVFTEN